MSQKDPIHQSHSSSRQYRPQRFDQVIGQETCVQTLKNSIRMGKIANAYLFCGTRGTGKTTLARIFAKALNCLNFNKELMEPCGQCIVCREIAIGSSLDVLEIDGASNRGIDDIRQLSESISYAPAHGKYKIFLIDEVHMLTKEAFNALLKNLEEPPPSAKFFFATTEPNKIPETIVSRCQRFNLRRLKKESIVQKLGMIAQENSLNVDSKALFTIAHYADGGLRDAESLFDQLVAFAGNNEITSDLVEEVLGLAPQTWFDEIDKAICSGSPKAAFDITDKLLLASKDVGRFIEDLSNHFRALYLAMLGAQTDGTQTFLPELLTCLQEEHVQKIFHYLHEAMKSMKAVSSQRFLIEKLLIDILTVRFEIPLPYIVKKLVQLEERRALAPIVQSPPVIAPPPPTPPIIVEKIAEKRNTPFQAKNEEQEKRRQENLMHFAAVELEGTLQKKKQI